MAAPHGEDWNASVRDVEERARAAFLGADLAVLDQLWSADYVVNTPLGRVARKAEVLEMLRTGRIRHLTFEVTIEHVARFGDVVVVMGRDAVTDVPGTIVHRRFTNVWRLDGGAWRGIARHANVSAQSSDPGIRA